MKNNSCRAVMVGFALLFQSVSAFAGAYYEYSVIARAGDRDLRELGNGPSINRLGQVAFTGRYHPDASGQPREGVFVGDGSTFQQLNISRTVNWEFGEEAQISHAGYVVTRAKQSLPIVGIETEIALWGPLPNSGNVVERNLELLHGTGLLESPALAKNSGLVSYAKWYIPENGTKIRTLQTTSGTYGEGNFTQNQGRLHYHPAATDDGRTVFRLDDLPSTPIGLAIDPALQLVQIIANQPRGGFRTRLGASPGVSSDGMVVAFAGQSDRANSPGIYISVQNEPDNNRSSRTILRVVGEDIGRFPATADLGTNSSGQPYFFSNFDLDSRVAVISQSLGAPGIEDDAVVVSFIGTPNAIGSESKIDENTVNFVDTKGIWTIRGTIKRSLVNPNEFVFKRQETLPVIQLGQSYQFGSPVFT